MSTVRRTVYFFIGEEIKPEPLSYVNKNLQGKKREGFQAFPNPPFPPCPAHLGQTVLQEESPPEVFLFRAQGVCRLAYLRYSTRA